MRHYERAMLERETQRQIEEIRELVKLSTDEWYDAVFIGEQLCFINDRGQKHLYTTYSSSYNDKTSTQDPLPT